MLTLDIESLIISSITDSSLSTNGVVIIIGMVGVTGFSEDILECTSSPSTSSYVNNKILLLEITRFSIERYTVISPS